MESQPTPRITAPYLDSYRGRNVIVVGRVVQLRGEVAVIDADGNITAHLNRVRERSLPTFFVPSQTPPPSPVFQSCEFHSLFFLFELGPSQLILGGPQPLQEAHLSNGNAVQIIGKVNPDLSIRALNSLDLGAGVGTFPPGCCS